MAEPGKIGVVAATLMVAGNIMGSGIFMLPANLAATGGIATLRSDSKQVVWAFILTLLTTLLYARNLNRRAAAMEAAFAVAREGRQRALS